MGTRSNVGILLASALIATACPPPMGEEMRFTITFLLSDASASVASLSFTVAYQGGGSFEGTGSSVSCKALATADSTTFSDDDAREELTIQLSNAAGIPKNTNLASCVFLSTVPPMNGNFSITVDTATDTSSTDIASSTQVTVSSISEGSTTTVSSTMTTVTSTTTSSTTTTNGPTGAASSATMTTPTTAAAAITIL